MAEPWPQPAPWKLRPGTDPYRPALLLVLDSDSVVDGRGAATADEVRRLALVAEDDHRFGAVRRLAESPVGVVAGVRARNAESGPEAVDRTRLAVVLREDHRAAALGCGQRLADASNRAHEFRPADRLGGLLVEVRDRRVRQPVDRH